MKKKKLPIHQMDKAPLAAPRKRAKKKTAAPVVKPVVERVADPVVEPRLEPEAFEPAVSYRECDQLQSFDDIVFDDTVLFDVPETIAEHPVPKPKKSVWQAFLDTFKRRW